MLDKLKKKFVYKVSAVFISIIIVLSLVITLWTYFYSSETVFDSYERILSTLFENKAQEASELFARIDIATELLLNESNEFVKKLQDKEEDIVYKIHLYEDVRNIFSTNMGISINEMTENCLAALFVTEEAGIYDVCPNPEKMDLKNEWLTGVFRIENIEDTYEYEKANDANGDFVWFKHSNDNYIYALKRLYYYKVVGGSAEIFDVGMVSIAVDVSMMTTGLENNTMTNNAAVALIDINGNTVYQNKNTYDNSNDYFKYEMKINDELTMQVFVLKKDMYKIMNNYTLVSLMIVALFTVVGIFAVVFLSNYLTKPIARLSEHMRCSEMMKCIESDKNRVDEIGIIYETYNQMICQINEMIKKENERVEEKRLMELKLMQTQINPHFIYNSLDNVNCRMMLKGEFDIANRISELVNYMRYNFKMPGEYSTLRKEIEMINSYLSVLELQYEDRIKFEVDIPEQLMECYISKMIIQPLIENAIIHPSGYAKMDEPLDIIIKAYEEKDDLIISITDSGTNIDVAKINKHISGELNISGKGGYGIRNVNERLKLIYGEQYGLKYKHDSNGHTMAVFSVKMKK